MSEEKRSCTVCSKNEDERVLIKAVVEGKEGYVCVKCLPALIHGR
ncbi:hypothetical protein [Desulfuribacillus stibiiarsenatis]|nr:hypothetical protein [Desulfuribacillus stibiiarsenatis]